MEEPVLFQAKAEYSEESAVFPLWGCLTFFIGCLVAALLFAGIRGAELFHTVLRVIWIPAVILALFQVWMHLSRGRFWLLATPTAVILRSAPLFGTRKDTRIPFSMIRNVRVYRSTVCVDTADKTYKLRHSADAQQFAANLRQLLIQSGVQIEKTEAEKYRERIELTARWKRRQVEKALYPETPVQLPSTTDEYGNPILPQQLTAEQAEGVFVPAQDKQEEDHHAGTGTFAGRG